MTTGHFTPLSDLERDALGEISNIAMARAVDSLRQMVGHEVLLSVPTIEILSQEAAAQIVAKPDNPKLVGVRQDFSGAFSGRALLIFPEANSLEPVCVVVGRQLPLEDIVDLEDEALAETGNIILNSWVATIANLFKRGLKRSLPVVTGATAAACLKAPRPPGGPSCSSASGSRSAIRRFGVLLLC
jgi:chemotaxis protein CheC